MGEDKEHKEIEPRSEELHEVMEKVPPWILRTGITVLFVIVLVILSGSFFFKYLDVIAARIVLTGSTPPTDIIAFSSGKLNVLDIGDNQEIKAGDYIAVINNPAPTDDVLLLKRFLLELDIEQDSVFVMPKKDLQLGNLQSLFSSFYVTLFNYNEYIRLQYYPNKIKMTKQQIIQYEEQYRSLLRQQKITGEQADLIDKSYARNEELYEAGGVSGKELDESRIRQLQSEQSKENMLNTINNMRIQLTQLNESIIDMEHQNVEKTNDFRSQIRSMVLQIKTEIQSWEMSYVLMSPVDGKITFTSYWVSNQNVRAGEVIFTVIPTSEYTIIGKASLPIARSGKVKNGQNINIRLDNFTDSEFGMLKGKVKNISLVPATSGESMYYVVEIELPDGLNTNYNKELPYLPNMHGQADIITENMSFLEKFVMPLRQIFKEGF